MPPSRRTRALLLWCAATDKTFERATARGAPVIAGKCIHCNTALVLAPDGTAVSRATVEHIVPRTHGGTDAIENLAIACARCNGGKGIRHDPRDWNDPGLQAVIATLRARREARMRDAPEGWALPPYPPAGQRTGGARDAEDAGGTAPADRHDDAPRDEARAKGGGRGRGRSKQRR